MVITPSKYRRYNSRIQFLFLIASHQKTGAAVPLRFLHSVLLVLLRQNAVHFAVPLSKASITGYSSSDLTKVLSIKWISVVESNEVFYGGETTMFPKQLDGAKVLYFTPKGEYGEMHYNTGGIAARFQYLAICKYSKSDGYYLFYCNEHKEVETDNLYNSIDACMNAANRFCNRHISWLENQ